MSRFRSLAMCAPLDYLRSALPQERIIRMAKIVTANTLATGHVVFRAADGCWVADVARAATFSDEVAAEETLALARGDQERGLIVDPFVTDKGGADGGGRPAMTLRDTIRAFGPTIRYLPDGAGRG